jgi:hypothetical protein
MLILFWAELHAAKKSFVSKRASERVLYIP